jgi:hypothetical protein
MVFNKGHALVIGVGSYSHIPGSNIPISVSDAKQVKEVLCNPNLCGYRPEQVRLLHDDGATGAGIISALDGLAKTTAEATVLLYYCGHGAYGSDGNYYLTTYDTQVSGNKVVKGTGISEVELLDKLRAIPAKRLLLLFNACHSGEISPNLGIGNQEKSFGDVSLPPKATEAVLSSGEGRIIITASRPEQKSWIGTGKLSIFTQALVDGLSGKGYVANNNGYVSVFGLYEHVYAAVKEAAGRLGQTQEPELTVLRGVGPFPVSLYMGATDPGVFVLGEPLPEGTAAREVDPVRSKRVFKQFFMDVTLNGSGAIAQRGEAKAVGQHGVIVGRDLRGGTIITGHRNVFGNSQSLDDEEEKDE